MFNKLKNLFNNNSSSDGDEVDSNKQNGSGALASFVKVKTFKYRMILMGIVVAAIVFFLMMITTLMALGVIDISDIKGVVTHGSSYGYTVVNNKNNGFWWPIGSDEIEVIDGITYAKGTPSFTNISSNFGYRDLGSGQHDGIDIAIDGEVGKYNVIAVKDGTVYYTNDGCDSWGSFGNNCGGGFGNYVILDHGNNVYTIYGHMASGSITVTEGDTVKQGQVIGKVGSSGSSTGPHLHFQVEIGGRGASYVVDPLLYVDASNPRPSGSGGNKFLKMIANWEGTGPTDGVNYFVYADTGGVLTVGYGIAVQSHGGSFSAHGIDPNTLVVGSPVPVTIVDEIEMEIINGMRQYVITGLESKNIPLSEDYQIDALTSFTYNVGNINCFLNNYAQYELTENMYKVCFAPIVRDQAGNYLAGLAMRREAEWKLLTTGVYPF